VSAPDPGFQHGVEWNPIANPAGYPPGQSYADNLLLSGGTHIFAPCSGYSCGEAVTHPEVGKYLIAIGEWGLRAEPVRLPGGLGGVRLAGDPAHVPDRPLCLGLIIGPARASPRRRAIGAAIAGTYVLAVLILFWYFYPILAGQIIPYSSWSARMWYRGWI